MAVGPIFLGALLLFVCIAALFRPHIGLIGYFGWSILNPEYLWSWSLSGDAGYQKYIVVATLLGWAIRGFPGNPLRGTPLYACVGLTIYLVLSWISSFQSHDPYQTAYFMSVIWKLVLMCIIAIRMLDTPQKLMAMMWVSVIAQGYNAYEINMQYFSDGYSWALQNGWGFTDNNTYSIVTIPLMAFSASLVLFSSEPWKKLVAAVIFILQLHQIFLLESRGCLLGSFLLGAIVWRNSPKTVQTRLAAIFALIFALVLAGPPVISEFSSIFAGKEERDASAESRFAIWEAGWRITMDYPLLGVGPWGAETTVPKYYPGGTTASRKALHNLFFEVSTGSGIPATVAYVTFFFAPYFAVRRLWKRQRDQLPRQYQLVCVSVLAAIPAYWVSSMFSSGILLETGYLSAVLASAMLAMYNSESGRTTTNGQEKDTGSSTHSANSSKGRGFR